MKYTCIRYRASKSVDLGSPMLYTVVGDGGFWALSPKP